MAQLCPNTPSTMGSQVPAGAPPPPPFLPHPTFSSRRLPWPLIQSSQLLPGPSAQPSSLPIRTNCASPSIKPFLHLRWHLTLPGAGVAVSFLQIGKLGPRELK